MWATREMLEHREISPGVHLARAVYGKHEGDTVIQLINLNSREVDIRCDEVIGEMTPVSLVTDVCAQTSAGRGWHHKVSEMVNDLPAEVTPKEKR